MQQLVNIVFINSFGAKCVLNALVDNMLYGYNIEREGSFDVPVETYFEWIESGDWEVISGSLPNALKSPEQLLREQEKLLAEERYTHYKAKMEAAKKDMEYWEGKL